MVRPISGNSKSNMTEITYRVEQSSICVDVSMNISVQLNIFFWLQQELNKWQFLSVRQDDSESSKQAFRRHSENT